MTKTNSVPCPPFPLEVTAGEKRTLLKQGEGARKALEFEALGPLALDVKLIPVGLGWRPQDCPILILAWASPHSQETLPLQQRNLGCIISRFLPGLQEVTGRQTP